MTRKLILAVVVAIGLVAPASASWDEALVK